MAGLEDTGAACTACGAALAPEQRYCVECGQRRGRSDLPFAPVAIVEYDDVPSANPAASRWRMSTNTGFIAGVGVLLIALGVGVLIGRGTTTASASKTNTPVQVVTLGGGAAGAAGTTGAAGATPATGAGTPVAGATPATGAKTKTSTAQVNTSTSSTTVVSAVEHTRPLTGPNRPGYHNGKFTGNFFGP